MFARGKRIARILNSLDYKVCDGYPLSRAINTLYGLNQERVDGYNLFHSTVKSGIKKNTRHFFFGNVESVVLKMIKELETLYPEIKISGYYCPPMLNVEQLKTIENKSIINKAEADIVWISLGFPKQEQFMEYIQEKNNNFNILGVGNVFDWVAKTKYKAPNFMADNGFEWLFRFSQEPFRLARRYLIDNTLFIIFFTLQKFKFKFNKD